MIVSILTASASAIPPPIPVWVKKLVGYDSTIVPVRAIFYDQPIAGLDGEFGARKKGECGYDTTILGPENRPPFSVIPDMLQDTLSYSKALRKKIPAKGPLSCNSLNIEKWFDPAYASGLGCKELPFSRMSPSADSSSFFSSSFLSFKDTLFFPIDSLAPPDQLEETEADFKKDPDLGPEYSGVEALTFPPWYQGKHNFNWCMEINAQFKYKGGETFAFKGDDDVWVYLDNKMVVDLGGLHGEAGPENPLNIDTLPFIQGREGETFDFDLYFCERRPGGSSFTINTSLDIQPATFQDLEIVDTAGQPLDPAAPFVGKQRLCAMPLYAQSFCGNSADRPPGRFLPATWSQNGAVIAKDSCIDLDPNELPFNTRITLAAKAEGKTAKLNLQVLKANLAQSIVLKGNGRLETLELPMDSRSDSLEAPVRVDYPFAGARRTDSAFSGSFIASRHLLSLTLPEERKGPVGRSGMDTGKGLYTQTVLGQPIQLTLPLLDSITPVLRNAAWMPSPRDGGLQLHLSPSETLTMPFPHTIPLLFKSKHGQTWLVELSGGKFLTESAQCDTFRVGAPTLPFSPNDADSISLSEAARDLNGNAARPYFLSLAPVGLATDKAEIISVGLEANPIRGDRTTPIRSPVSLVVIDKQGNPYSSAGDNARLAEAPGPVIAIRSAERLDRLDIQVYSNLGAPVDTGMYSFTDAEWDKMLAESGSDTASARVLWYPSANGVKLGTGAYIIKGSISTKGSYAQDVSGQWHEKSPGRKFFGPLLFGYLRE